MKAMILAAGEGRRLRPLTQTCPKPLIPIGGIPLIEHHIRRLAKAGVPEIIINVSYLGEQIIETLGTGERWGVDISFFNEAQPRETGGGVNNALVALGQAPFILVNGDVYTHYPFERLLAKKLDKNMLGHVVLIPNPEHNPNGDFCLVADGQVTYPQAACTHFTFSGISLLRPAIVADYPSRREAFPLKEAFDWAIDKNKISGELYDGCWIDVGTVERVEQANHAFHSAR